MTFFDRQTWRVLSTALLFAVSAWLLFSLRELFFLLVLGLFLAYTIEPLIAYLQRLAPKSISRNSAIVVIYILVLLVVGSALAWLGRAVTSQAAVLIAKFPEIAKDPGAAMRLPLPPQLEPFRDDILKFGLDFAQRAVAGILGSLGSAGLALVVPIFALYFLKDGASLSASAISLAAGFGMGGAASRLLDELHHVLSKYIRAVLLLSTSVFLVYAAFYQAMGVPYAMLLATMAAMFEIIPVLGWITAAFLSVVIVTFSGYLNLGWLLAFYLVFRLIQDYVIAPFLLSKGVELHPLAVLAGVIGGEMVGGLPGMFLSIPVLATARVLFLHWQTPEVGSDAPDS